ncbi:hypothetical protein [Streptomyces sp. AP-93]|uniref:hypothetical protein n=1 Tax=Streptomyces sp. AP-93 TaxID=2929048 RepID=UPI001FAF0FC3|nr:hypothetical protein [Streptomyces sp. AP-93]MCJ0873187.1 hypothetical protein [Streptomyces sp. AP-93]
MRNRAETVPTVLALLAGLGAVTGGIIWASRSAYALDGGFESEDQDLSVLFVDLPLILIGGVLIPAAAYAVARQRRGAGIVLALVATGLAAWGLMSWWTPQQGPDGYYEPGM